MALCSMALCSMALCSMALCSMALCSMALCSMASGQLFSSVPGPARFSRLLDARACVGPLGMAHRTGVR
jgi:hypothetical protein